MPKILNIIITAFIAIFIFTALGISYLINIYSTNLPSYEQLKSYTPIVSTRIYASDGQLLGEFAKEKRVFVPISIIPKNLINAFLAAEDSNFYKHSGIDPFAIIRAAGENVIAYFKGNDLAGGASTITQQVVKNFLLSNERTWKRKIKEAILAFRLTKAFSKDEILELYLNQIYLGSGAYGVAAAAQIYFNKSIDQLSIEEMALLATLPKAPSKLDPRKNIEKAKIRRDWVIQRMINEKFITNEEGLRAMAKPIVLVQKDDDSVTHAAFFSDAVKKELIGLYGSENVFESGIVVRTTLDPKLQTIARHALQAGIENYDQRHGYRGALGNIKSSLGNWQDGLKKFKIDKLYKSAWIKAVVLDSSATKATIGLESDEKATIDLEGVSWARKYYNADSIGSKIQKVSDVLKPGDIILVDKQNKNYVLKQIPEVNGALLAMDPHSGKVLAMMGGYIDTENQFNRATQAKRQPGSALKPFGYIAAFENGMNPATIIMDEEITLDQGGDLPPYKPTNYSNEFYGPTTLRKGLEKSINVTTVRMASQIGLDKVADVFKRFGINPDPAPIYSLVLGSTETTLTNLVSAYSAIVNGGKKITPSIIEKIQDRDGKIIFRRDQRQCQNCIITNPKENTDNMSVPMLSDNREQITDSQTAYQITSILEGAAKRGTAAKAKAIGKIVGGKTGTTNNFIDSWFIGFSPDLVVGVYIGFDIPKTLGNGEAGASVALPVFIDFMTDALKDVPSKPFRIPDGIKFVKIDMNTGLPPTISTPKNYIIFEAFKPNDQIENSSSDDAAKEFNNQYESNPDSNNVGIY